MLKINKTIKILIFSDICLWFAWGLVSPIFAIFIVQNIKGGGVEVVGIAAGIYWVVKSLVQIPIAKFVDNLKGEKDDFYILLSGLILTSLVPIGFIFINFAWQLYLLQVIYGIGMALIVPAWAGTFTRHIEKGREAFCWSLDSSGLGLGIGIAGIIGGLLVGIIGFNFLFAFVSILGLCSVLVFLLVEETLLSN